MKCPRCKHEEFRVLETRKKGFDTVIPRLRVCLGCGKVFETHEVIVEEKLDQQGVQLPAK